MVVTLGQQYSVGEKPTVILYTNVINRHAATPDRKQKQNRNNEVHHQTGYVVIIYCFIGYKDKTSRWHLNGFPDDCSNLGSTV